MNFFSRAIAAGLLFSSSALAQDARPLAPDAGHVVTIPTPDTAAETDRPERLAMPGLPNVAHVDRGVYRGGRPQIAEGGVDSLARLKIKTVINLEGGDLTSASKSGWTDWRSIILRMEPGESPLMIDAEKSALEKVGASMISAPISSLDPISPDEAATLDKLLAVLGAASEEFPVYVHCEHGKDRTGLVLALYRMRYDGWTQARAATEMAEMGHTGRLDELFTSNMDLNHVLASYPLLGTPPLKPSAP